MEKNEKDQLFAAIDQELCELAEDLGRDAQQLEQVAVRIADSVGKFYRSLTEHDVPEDLSSHLTSVFLERMLGQEQSTSQTIVHISKE